jgi:hypothetical protein
MVLGTVLLLPCGLAGCGPSASERAAQERKRLELEEQAPRDAQKANQAITTMNKKLGRKPPELDLGLMTATKTEAASNPPKQP